MRCKKSFEFDKNIYFAGGAREVVGGSENMNEQLAREYLASAKNTAVTRGVDMEDYTALTQDGKSRKFDKIPDINLLGMQADHFLATEVYVTNPDLKRIKQGMNTIDVNFGNAYIDAEDAGSSATVMDRLQSTYDVVQKRIDQLQKVSTDQAKREAYGTYSNELATRRIGLMQRVINDQQKALSEFANFRWDAMLAEQQAERGDQQDGIAQND